MSSYPPACPHDPLREIADDVFMVHASFRINPLIRISRNMAVIRQGEELILVNPVRMNQAGLEKLDALGRVRALVRLGSMHGVDDAFYVARYGCELWAQEGPCTYPDPAADRVLEEGSGGPVDGATVFCFHGAAQPEAALLLEDHRLLLTCDAIQHYGAYSQCSPLARLMMPFIGFPKTTLVGPFWLKRMTPEGGSLRREFERLLTLDFEMLLAAHGTCLERGAHRAVGEAVARAYR